MGLFQDLSGDENEDSSSNSTVGKLSFDMKDMGAQRDRNTKNNGKEWDGQEVFTDKILERLRESQTIIIQKRAEHRTPIAILK